MTVPRPQAAVPPAPATVFPTSAEFAGGRLTGIGGVAVDRLVDEYGTPLWVLDGGELGRRMHAVAAAMADPADVVYAAKALCVTGVLQLVARAGLSVDVATAGELATAVHAHVPGARLVVHGNNKSRDELRAALRAGAGRIVVDSFDELDRLEELTRTLDTTADVWLRVTPGVEASTHAFVRTGQDDSKFGFTLSSGLAGRAVERVEAADRLRLRGLHSHIGSQIAHMGEFTAAAERMVAMVAELDRRHGITLAELDVGGGVGIAYTTTDSVPAPGEWARRCRAAVADAVAAHRLAPLRVLVEPGRALVGPAGVTLYTVGTVKHLPGLRTFVAVDGGMSDNLRPALYGVRYTFAPAGTAPRPDGPLSPSAGRPDGELTDPVMAGEGITGRGVAEGGITVVGKHCESGDVLGRDVDLPAVPRVGETLAVAATGAYHHSLSSNYNRLPRPAMVLVDDGTVRPLLRRETVADLLVTDIPLPPG